MSGVAHVHQAGVASTSADHALLTLLGVTALFWLLMPLASTACGPRISGRLWGILVALGSVPLAGCAIRAWQVGSRAVTLPGPFGLGSVRFEFRFDPLSDGALILIAFIGAATSPYLRGYMALRCNHADARQLWLLYPWLLASMALVVLAANVQTFLVTWEMMSLSSFLLVALDHAEHRTRQVALTYLAATRIGTGLLAGGFLWVYSMTRTWEFASWHLTGLPALGPGLLILAGLGVKAGMWPFHLWLPIAHPAAPAPVSAVMSGVMVKVAIVLIARLFVIDQAFINPSFGWIMLTLGAMGAAWGIPFALVQQDMKRILALSTVENIGLILVGLGAGLVARSWGLIWAADLAVAGALLHVINHAIFKSLLFLGAGAVDASSKTRDLGALGGLGRRMPTTYACFLVGAASICALPPLSGFASEWLLYRAAMVATWQAHAPLIRFAGLLAVTGLALIGSLVGACFVRVVGVAFQGRPRSVAAEHTSESPLGMRTSQVVLASASALIGLCAPIMVRMIQAVLGPLSVGAPKLESAWTLPIGASTLTFMVTCLLVAAWLYARRAADPVRVARTWDCGFGELGPRAQVTSVSFAQPVARMFGALFSYAQSMRFEGVSPQLFPLGVTAESSVDHPLEHHVYGPLVRWFAKLSDKVIAFQQGSIHRYLLTMLLSLVILLGIEWWLK